VTVEPDPTPAPEQPEPPPEQQPSGDYPMWLRILLVVGSFVTMLAHIVYDAVTETYEGASISLMLGGLVGTALGFNEWLRNRGGGGAA
jgi:hypothetical protein